MKISKNIISSIKEAVEDNSKVDYKEFNKQIAFLIEDEKEAIAGYKNALDILKDKMTSEQNDEIYKVLNHIILEEKEHIEELKKLKNDLE